MIFSNYVLASGSCKLGALIITFYFFYFIIIFFFFLHKLHIQVPISRNTLKCLNLEKLKHDITCKSYTKDNSKVRFT